MTLRVAIAQINPVVGDVAGNVDRILDQAVIARDELGADLLICPELALCGYPPEDLLFHGNMRRSVGHALEQICSRVSGISVLAGYPEYEDERIYNSAALIADGGLIANYRKQLLPNYGVFDERRYFTPGDRACVAEVAGVRCGIMICEDIWHEAPAEACRAAGAQVLLVINGSPYDTTSQQRREEVLRLRSAGAGLPVVYCNMVGGQDELVFDGGSVVVDAGGQVVQRAPAFEESTFLVHLDADGSGVTPRGGTIAELPEKEPSVYQALVLGVRDYVDKHHFPGVVLGLSGGIDSALTLAIAVDALGAERVRTVMMPSRYTADISLEDAQAMADGLGVRHDVISIEPIFRSANEALAGIFAGREEDVTEENIQSRCRGMILMAISNKLGLMLLTTGNKSEMAVGYATLYGDMAGGFAPIKDCSKSMVFRLADYRNSLGPVIPARIIERPPSAELRHDQKDTDALPPYEVMDPILSAFIEEDCSVDEIVGRGFDRATVGRILGMVKQNEYKRRQAPPGIRVSRRAFGRDWRYPITSGFDAE
ncbi:MAG: NAD+ synthase [Gammaproteobacteria bacterium]|jgi:NAD+ synthase (glutamine-hydrolysing)